MNVLSDLEEEGFQVEKSPIIPEAIRVTEGKSSFLNRFKDGLFTIQDESSMLVAYALGAT